MVCLGVLMPAKDCMVGVSSGIFEALNAMSLDIKESDWKKLRKLSEVALARAFDRAIARMQTIQSMNRKSQIKFWDIKNYADKQSKLLARLFDGMKRSNAMDRLMMIWRENLLTDDEIKSFSPETRQMVRQLGEYYGL